ncbi:hypothetical protein SAMN05216357_10858 [Porphyromonadaceae bacterium KH3CP3RA]|nr:hypothetical protein SAMN05216357_10858 [Porphyromonadaceae bacterium KH3CP3RA]
MSRNFVFVDFPVGGKTPRNKGIISAHVVTTWATPVCIYLF